MIFCRSCFFDESGKKALDFTSCLKSLGSIKNASLSWNCVEKSFLDFVDLRQINIEIRKTLKSGVYNDGRI